MTNLMFTDDELMRGARVGHKTAIEIAEDPNNSAQSRASAANMLMRAAGMFEDPSIAEESATSSIPRHQLVRALNALKDEEERRAAAAEGDNDEQIFD